MLSGVIRAGGREWQVREEKRQGPRSQIFILEAVDAPGCEMHVRPAPGSEATRLEEVELLALDAEWRWFIHRDGERWGARLVLGSSPGADAQLIKFISGDGEVAEGEYPYHEGLGARTEDELSNLLEVTRAVSS